MRLDYNIHSKHIRINVLVQTENVVSHSILSSDEQLQQVIAQGINYIKSLIEHYDKLHDERLGQVGK